jgi:hypothetical protein
MSATLSVYELKNFDSNGSWEKAWAFVKANYGSDAICREVISAQITEQQFISDLTEATTKKSDLNTFLWEEVELGATHAFVQRANEGAIFGIDLESLK